MSFCIQCGAKLPEGAKFCISCGTSAWSENQPQTTIPADPFIEKQQASAIPSDPFTGKQQGSAIPSDPFAGKQQASAIFSDPFAGKQQGAPLFKRIKGIIFKPLDEWNNIAGETPNVKKIFLGYVLILLLIPSLSVFIGIGVIGQTFLGYHYTSLPAGALQGFIQLLAGLVSIRITSALVTILAPGFDSIKDSGRSIQLVSYSMTPYWILGILYILPSLAFLKSLAMIAGGIYSIYLMYMGMPVLLKTPAGKTPAFLVLLIVIQFAIMFCLFWVLGLLAPLFF